MDSYFKAWVGGILIGCASLLMLVFNGRILGVSGIVGSLLQPARESKDWKLLFLVGLLIGGLVILILNPAAYQFSLARSPAALVIAGLLVGYGTRLGSGCTSGHGICGVSRLSPRSLVATITFMAFGAATVLVINHLLGGRI